MLARRCERPKSEAARENGVVRRVISLADRALRVRVPYAHDHVGYRHSGRIRDLDDELTRIVEPAARLDVLAGIGGQVEPHGGVLRRLPGGA